MSGGFKLDQAPNSDYSPTEGSDLSLLDVIGNPTRRRILALLSCEPHYASQLARLLSITQPAVVKQLQLLEKEGLVKAERRPVEGEKGPNRLFYNISKEFLLVYSIGSFSTRGRCWETSADRNELKQDYTGGGLLSLNEMAEELIELEKEIYNKEQEITGLERQRNSILQQAFFLLSSDKDLGKSKSYVQRAIIRALLVCDDKVCVEELAKTLDKGETEIVAHIKKLGSRGLVELDSVNEDVWLTTDS
jgi:predicted transcriptional regulator